MTTLGPRTIDRAVATLHVRPPGAMLERSDAMHPAVTRLYPEHGGESGGVGGAIAGSLSAEPRGPALQTVYPRVAHQRCWVHTLRNLLGAVRRRDYAATSGSFLLV